MNNLQFKNYFGYSVRHSGPNYWPGGAVLVTLDSQPVPRWDGPATEPLAKVVGFAGLYGLAPADVVKIAANMQQTDGYVYVCDYDYGEMELFPIAPILATDAETLAAVPAYVESVYEEEISESYYAENGC